MMYDYGLDNGEIGEQFFLLTPSNLQLIGPDKSIKALHFHGPRQLLSRVLFGVLSYHLALKLRYQRLGQIQVHVSHNRNPSNI